MEQIFFAILIGVVALLRLVMQAAEKKRNAEAAKRAAPKLPQANAPVPRAPAQSEEERVRRFMEALGVPTTNAPAPRAPRRVVVPKSTERPKRKIMPIDPFPAPRSNFPTPPIEAPPPVVIAAPPPPLPPVVAARPPRSSSAAPAFNVTDIQWGSEQASQPDAVSAGAGVVRQQVVGAEQSWAARLVSAQGARDAIVLREIFGPPRSLRPFDLTEIAP
jgi:hypothetical protein